MRAFNHTSGLAGWTGTSHFYDVDNSKCHVSVYLLLVCLVRRPRRERETAECQLSGAETRRGCWVTSQLELEHANKHQAGLVTARHFRPTHASRKLNNFPHWTEIFKAIDTCMTSNICSPPEETHDISNNSNYSSTHYVLINPVRNRNNFLQSPLKLHNIKIIHYNFNFCFNYSKRTYSFTIYQWWRNYFKQIAQKNLQSIIHKYMQTNLNQMDQKWLQINIWLKTIFQLRFMKNIQTVESITYLCIIVNCVLKYY